MCFFFWGGSFCVFVSFYFWWDVWSVLQTFHNFRYFCFHSSEANMNIQAVMKIFSNESGFDEDISKWRCGFDVRTLFLLESFVGSRVFARELGLQDETRTRAVHKGCRKNKSKRSVKLLTSLTPMALVIPFQPSFSLIILFKLFWINSELKATILVRITNWTTLLCLYQLLIFFYISKLFGFKGNGVLM